MSLQVATSLDMPSVGHTYMLGANASTLPEAFAGRSQEMDVINSFKSIFANTSFHLLNSSSWSYGKSEFNQDLLHEFWETLFTHRQTRSILLICLYVPVFLMAFLGNTMVLLVVLLHRHMRNVTNCFIVNLAIADILVTIVCIPMAIGQSVYRLWVYGEFMCRFTGYLQGVSVASSIFTIMLLSIDRYLAIRHPMTFRTFSAGRHPVKIVAISWTFSLSIMVPLLFVRRVDTIALIPTEQLHFCNEVWQDTGHRVLYDIFLFICMFVLPGVFVTLSYSRLGCRLWTEGRHLHRKESAAGRDVIEKVMTGRRRVARILVVLAILFATCWMPYHLLVLYIDFLEKPDQTSLYILPYTIWLGHANSALNPILYCFMSPSFMRTVCKMLHLEIRKKKTRNQVELVVEYAPSKGQQSGKPELDYGPPDTGSRTSMGSLRFSRSTYTSFRSSYTSGNSGKTSNSRKECRKVYVPNDQGDDIRRQTLTRIDVHQTDICLPIIRDGSSRDPALTPSVITEQRGRREIFSHTLSIPTTINEETSWSKTSRCSSPCL